MKDEIDLKEMGELVEALENTKKYNSRGNCDICPLHFISEIVHDECIQIHLGMFDEAKYNDVQCRKVLDKKISEITTYILERSLKDE